jgi:hypothetical protein
VPVNHRPRYGGRPSSWARHPIWAGYAERSNSLLGADIGVPIQCDTLKSDAVFRTQVLDYVWANLPTVVAMLGHLSQHSRAREHHWERLGEVLSEYIAENGRELGELARQLDPLREMLAGGQTEE